MHEQMRDAGFRIFGLHTIDKNGQCGCGTLDCPATGKHPVASSWQHTPPWSDDQLSAMEEAGHFATGYGVLVGGHLVIDVDARNGGVESYAQLCADHPTVTGAGMIVETGSGNGSKHLYFRLPEPMALVQHLPDYPGIDFKSTGFVVGPGSLHASGNRYQIAHGGPEDVDEAPAELVQALHKPETFRGEVSGHPMDVTTGDLEQMLSIMDPDCDYEQWIRVGMAIHHATSGANPELWDAWSKAGSKYPGHDTIQRHWHSFGKCSNPATLGTLVYYAEQCGWKQSVTFTDDGQGWQPPKLDDPVDLLRPPGFVGDVASWIDQRCRFPREHLSVAAALASVGNVAGLRHIDARDGVTMNLFAFGVAGSGTGKEAIQQAMHDLHRCAGYHIATHGSIKSEQEIVRNLTRHQAALYVVDEIGIMLGKIYNAQKHGGAAYLDGVIGMLMSAYGKASGHMLLTGDVKEEVRHGLQRELAQARKIVAENEDKTGKAQARIPGLERALDNVDNGLERPFLSLVGFTTPTTFDHLVTAESATNGFIGRSLLVMEPETNPRPRKGHKPRKQVPEGICMRLAQLGNGGEYAPAHRVEHYGPVQEIPTDDEAAGLLDEAQDWFFDYAEQHKDATGMEAIPRRSYELVSKVSAILAVADGLRTAAHVRWAFAYVRRDCDAKLRLAYGNDRQRDRPGHALQARIMSLVDEHTGATVAYMANRLRSYKREDIEAAVSTLEGRGEIVRREEKHPKNQRVVVKWFGAA